MLDAIATLLLNLELESKAKLCLDIGFPRIVKDYPKMRNLPKIFLRSFENVGPGPTAMDTQKPGEDKFLAISPVSLALCIQSFSTRQIQ